MKYGFVGLVVLIIQMSASGCRAPDKETSAQETIPISAPRPDKSDPEKTPPPPKLFGDLSEILVVKDFGDFAKTTGTTSGTGSGTKTIYTDSTGARFIFKEGQPGWGEPGWLEAYAGVIYRYLLQEHAQETYFVKHNDAGTMKLYAAIKIESSFEDAFEYHETNGKPILDDAKGLAGIVIASMLLAEIDLKGISSNNSNLGIISKDGKLLYYKIDNGQSFLGFNGWAALYDEFDLKKPVDRLKTPKIDDTFLTFLGFYRPGMKGINSLGPKYLTALADEAKRIASIEDANLEKILDFCEAQLAVFAVYPALDCLDADAGNPMFSTPDATYKARILKRFAQLRDAIK